MTQRLSCARIHFLSIFSRWALLALHNPRVEVLPPADRSVAVLVGFRETPGADFLHHFILRCFRFVFFHR